MPKMGRIKIIWDEIAIQIDRRKQIIINIVVRINANHLSEPDNN